MEEWTEEVEEEEEEEVSIPYEEEVYEREEEMEEVSGMSQFTNICYSFLSWFKRISVILYSILSWIKCQFFRCFSEIELSSSL